VAGHLWQMSDESTATRFMSALDELDSSSDTGAIASLFADGAELLRPEVAKAGSSNQDPDQFWTDYRNQFSEVSTEFGEVQDAGSFAALEWRSTGKLTTGRSIEYAGVSLLTLDDEGKVKRFSTYYDTAAFLEPAGSGE
jgi:hypothetical protein